MWVELNFSKGLFQPGSSRISFGWVSLREKMGSVFLTWGDAEVAERTEHLHSPSISMSPVCDCHCPPMPVRVHWCLVFLRTINNCHVLLPTNLPARDLSYGWYTKFPGIVLSVGQWGKEDRYYIVLCQNRDHGVYLWHAKEEFQDRDQARKWLKWFPPVGLSLHKHVGYLLASTSHNSYPLPPVTATWFFSSGTFFPLPTIHVVLEWECEPGFKQTHGVFPE